MPTRGNASHMQGASKVFTIEEPLANHTPADGAGYDTKGREAVSFLVAAVAGTQGSGVVTFQEADGADENANYAAIADKDLEFPKAQTVFTTNVGGTTIGFATAGMFHIGYKGGKRWIRALISGATGTPDSRIMTGAIGTLQRHING